VLLSHLILLTGIVPLCVRIPVIVNGQSGRS
jgi:hypothetical protein